MSKFRVKVTKNYKIKYSSSSRYAFVKPEIIFKLKIQNNIIL